MRKICAITANRADFSRIETILRAVLAHPDLELQLVVIGGHLSEKTGRTVDDIKRKGFKITAEIETDVEGSTPKTMTQSVGVAIQKLAEALEELKPDVVIAPTDRFDTFAIGSAAALMNIHVAHIQGGEVTGTIDESIRHALTKLSHLHFVSTEKSRERVIKMGEVPEFVYNVGCPATDLLLESPSLSAKETLEQLNALPNRDSALDPAIPYILMMQHPVTTEFGHGAEQIEATLKALSSFDHQIVALVPNVDAGGDSIREVMYRYKETMPKLHLFHHIPTEIFTNVLRNAECQVGNSSSGVRESCYFGTPVVNIGTRQNSRERGLNVVDTDNTEEAIRTAIATQLQHGKYPVEHVYGDGTAGKQVADILATVTLPPVQKKITY